MLGKLITGILLFIVPISCSWAQQSEIECSVVRRNGDVLTLTPAYFDAEILPKPGDKVHLLLLVKSDLPPGKKEGYYELFTMDVVKITPDSKSISFKCDEDIDAARTKTGISSINLNSDSRVRITW